MSNSKTTNLTHRTVARKDWASWCTVEIPLNIAESVGGSILYGAVRLKLAYTRCKFAD